MFLITGALAIVSLKLEGGTPAVLSPLGVDPWAACRAILAPLRTCILAALQTGAPAWSRVLQHRWVALAVFGIAAYALVVLASWLIVGPVAGYLAGRRCAASARKTHGSAAWGTRDDAQQAGLICKDLSQPKLLLGAHAAGFLRPRALHEVDSHILTCAATGAGKGVGCVIYNLLTYTGSAFVLDLKGENYAVTAQARLNMGHAVARIDPFGLSGTESHAINWLACIDPKTPEGVSEAAVLADSLVVRTHAEDSHWDDSATYLLQGLILYAASMPPESRHIGVVRELLTSEESVLTEHLAALGAVKGDAGAGEVVGRVARTFLSKDHRERSGVLSTAIRHTRFLDDPRLASTLRRNDFSFRELKTSKVTVYLMLPPDMLGAYRSYVRATVALALRAMVKEAAFLERPVLFLLDEFAQLGRFQPVEDAIAILRGYHVRLWLFFQDLSQLRSTYRNWESFVANCTLQIFGTQDLGTAKYVSELLGQQTMRMHVQSQTQNQGNKGQGSHSMQQSESYLARPLLTPDEVRRLDSRDVLVFTRADKPQRLRRLNYLTDALVKGRSQSNPQYNV